MLTKISSFITNYFRAIFLAAIVLGLVFPSQLSRTYHLLTPLIILLMYLGSLDIEYDKLGEIVKNWKSVVGYYIIMMIILPVGLYFAAGSIFTQDIALGVYLLAAAPSGIAAVAFTRLMGGNILLSLCYAVITTITLPFLLPIMTQYIVGNTIALESMSMFIDLVLFCILPIIAAYLTQRYIPRIKAIVRPHIDWFSILMIGIMILGPVAYNASIFLSVRLSELLLIVGGLFVLSGLIHAVGWHSVIGGTREDKIAGALSKGFMNISVVTVIAAKYFNPAILLIVMLYEFPRDLMLIPFKKFLQLQNKGKQNSQ